MALLSRNQATFAARLAARTGLNPRLIGAWIIAEEPAGANAPVGHTGDQNWLNIGNTDSKWFPGAAAWRNPVTAADRSAAWLRGKESVPGFGHAAGGIVAFSKTAGKPIGEQISALQRSGWASSGYPDLPGLVRQSTGKLGLRPYLAAAGQPAASAPSRNGGPRQVSIHGAPTFKLAERQVFDAAGYARAQRRFALGQILQNRPASPFTTGGPDASVSQSNPLLNVLPTTAPNPLDFQDAVSSLERIAGKPIKVAVGGSGKPSTPTAGGLPRGKAIVAPGADRAGVPTSKRVRDFVSLVAGSVKHPVTITTGSNHSQMTTSGNVSDHWTGNAGDIAVPVDSRTGDMIAGRALLLAGVPRKQARRMAQQGGLYTLTPRSGPLKGMRVQIIWKTYEGGNHHNHVHIGIEQG